MRIRIKSRRAVAPIIAVLLLLGGGGALLVTQLPRVWAAVSLSIGHYVWMPPPSGLSPTPVGPMAGRVVGGGWRVQPIGPDTWAIGEPQDDPDNYEYLLVGRDRALLIDSGARSRDIRPVLAGLTDRPITVLPTHLHSDHTRGLRYFSRIALIDLPQTRARLRDGRVRLARFQYMAPLSEPVPSFPVAEWIRPDGEIDLGGRRVRVLSTPGHTATSVSIHDPAARLLFTGDMIYTTTLYAFMPDSSLSAYLATADHLLETLPVDTRIYGAHCCRNDRPAEAPWLTLQDLRDLRSAVAAVMSGKARGQGWPMKRYPVNGRMTLATFYPLGNR